MKRCKFPNHYLTILSLLVFGILASVFIPQTAYALTPSVDAVTKGPIGNRTITWQHTVGNNANRFLIVTVENNGQNVTSVTYNGVALSKLVGGQHATVGLAVYYLLNPPSGTHDIIVNGSSTLMGGAISLSNVNLADPFDHSSYTNGNCTPNGSVYCNPSLNPASDTELWVDWLTIEDTDSLQFTPMATATQIWNQHTGNKYFVSEYFPGVNGTITPSWNISPDPNSGSFQADHISEGIQIAPTPTPTPTPITYTISGNVYNDANKNGIKDPGESNYAGSPTITASSGTVTTHNDGTYTISNLPAGIVTVSYNSLPSGYKMTYPLNGPPSSFQVSVGPGCSTNGANGAVCQ